MCFPEFLVSLVLLVFRPRSCQIRPQIAGDAGSGNRREVNRRQGQAGTDSQRFGKCPFLQYGSFPTGKQRAAAYAGAGGVLRLDAQLMTLIETRSGTFAGE